MARNTSKRRACEDIGLMVEDGVEGVVVVAEVARQRPADPQVDEVLGRTMERLDRALRVRGNLSRPPRP